MDVWQRAEYMNNMNRSGVADENRDYSSWQRSGSLKYFDYNPANRKDPDEKEPRSKSQDPEPKKRPTWREAMYEFTQNTTFHGIRYVAEKNSWSVRRLIWIILILACSGLMSYQIIDRIIFYCRWPVTVNVEINFNKTIQFPSVAICNQNAFKITEAHRLGYLRLLELLYTKGTREYKLEKIRQMGMENTTFMELFLRTRHLREDMIVKCEWDSKPCHASHFVQILTDHGVCYAFASNTTDPLYITDTGTDHGLRLTLNVEQYEYMHGPHDSAGLKILLYDPAEEPLVYELGQAVATGTHTFVGVKVIQMRYLTQPYGNCTDQQKLKYYPYSETACKLECMHDFYVARCGCRLLHMAEAANTPVCNIGQYHDCILKAKDDFNAEPIEPCDCPQPCNVPMYEPNFSYSTTSNFDVDNLLSLVNSTELLRRYIKARDTVHSVEEKYFEEDKTVIETCIETFDDIRTLIHEEFPETIQDHLNSLKIVDSTVRQELNKRDFINRYQAFIVRKNFVRGVQAMDEKTLSSVSSDYFNFAYTFDHQIRLMMLARTDDAREILRDLLNITIGARRELTENALNNITEAETCYRTGTNILNYTFGSKSAEETRMVVPTIRLNKVVTTQGTYSWYYLQRIKSDLKDLRDDYDRMRYLIISAYEKRSLDTNTLTYILGNFTSHSRAFLGSRSYVLEDVFTKPLKQLDERNELWLKLTEELTKVSQEMRMNLANLLDKCKEIQETAWINSSVAMDHAREYLSDQSHGKTALAQIITDSALADAVTKLDFFFREIRTRGQGLHDNWDKYIDIIVRIWQFILEDDDSKRYYRYIKSDWADMDFELVKNRTTKDYKDVRYRHDLIRMIHSRDSVFISSIEKMMNLFKDYVAGNKLDADFYKQNFLQMDVFYRKLSYELIEQQKAYDMFGLLCDIGGSMGLFIGASALTIFELMDVFAYILFRKAAPKPPTRSRPSR